MTSTIDRARLDALFRPKSVAFIGASDKSQFSLNAFAQQELFGAVEHTFLINPNKDTVHGQRTYPSCAAVPDGFDCAYIMVPQKHVMQAMEDAAAAGAKAAVVLSSGYAEVDDEGKAAQEDLVAQAQRLGMILLGPNHLGFANMVDGVAVCALPDLGTEPGGIALVSQSGALAGTFTMFAARHGIRFSFAVTTGNEAMITAEEVVDYVLDDPSTKSVAVFAETIRKPSVFLTAVRKARQLGKAIVVLKAGSSELSARTAAAHTGALVGDDAVIDAVFRQEGVIRVDHMEELLVTAHLAAATGRWARPGVAVVSLSGGACDVVADRGEELGLEFPEFSTETNTRLHETISAFGHAQNPLDATGAALIDPTLLGKLSSIISEDPNVGFLLVIGGSTNSLPGIGAAFETAPVPAAFCATVEEALIGPVQERMTSAGITYLPSTRDSLIAMGRVAWWSRRLAEIEVDTQQSPTNPSGFDVVPGAPLSEWDVRGVLESAGVPVVPGILATSEAEAVDAAGHFAAPVAMKIVSAAIEHKSDIGGVALNVTGDENVREAYRSVLACTAKISPQPEAEGILVTPMRRGGVELLAGIVRDPQWGPVLAVGLGGIFVEILKDVALLPLPTSPADIRRALLSLRGAALLEGVRGTTPADIDKVVDAIDAIAQLAYGLGNELAALEVNPLHVNGTTVEALDGLINWTKA